jgi:porphobilinogen deaminase
MYIFQLIDQSKVGTKSARRQFQIQFDAVASETALARTFAG